LKRRKAREIVLKALYSLEVSDGKSKEVISDLLERENINNDLAAFTRKLFNSTKNLASKADKLIGENLLNWKIERVSSIERLILRMGIAEAIEFPDIPIQVTINEAVEIAKKYTSEKGSKFVNGLLDKILKEIRKK